MTSRCAEVVFDEDDKVSYICLCGLRFDEYLIFHEHAWQCSAIPRRQSSLELWMQKQKIGGDSYKNDNKSENLAGYTKKLFRMFMRQ